MSKPIQYYITEEKYVDLWSFGHFIIPFFIAHGFRKLGASRIESYAITTVLTMVYEPLEKALWKHCNEGIENQMVDVLIGTTGAFVGSLTKGSQCRG